MKGREKGIWWACGVLLVTIISVTPTRWLAKLSKLNVEQRIAVNVRNATDNNCT